ncbi:decaprenyl-phosphate phosphoribosyltransferase [Modestobacter sp. I12A-02628]|uniref:Decaprenyl-phosphate phosphoribosyltransferase n=1 Tax=Goekera deserti TaxID=2497753 RepID=A0A7K3W9V9_9ACTN|nr:decaprenyl-phosphate phosphoribosyltransferase [Goekera deserti]MPR00332.1 decaprenyl-phosphate phosphoribosyltransferase [Goekera deserti]NDI49506.1 decaprenyl-phosphate phosphoribosyltransferase [Goekera deserti]NEL52620.1 decaprenyl-phosphate phosphoribosyltransferase [Goekera deserti]
MTVRPEHPTAVPSTPPLHPAEPVRTVAPAPSATVQPTPAAGGLPPRPEGFRGSLAWGVVRAVRPKQWVKNVLVLAAPLAAGRVFEAEVAGPTAVAFALFCMSSAAVYLVNDTIDVEEDRRHPKKRFRPIAAGIVPRPLALALAAVLFTAALVTAALVTRPALAGVLASYVVIQLAYCLFLKNQPVIDLAVVASGFLLRGIAGGVAAGIVLSQWFLLVAAFGSLFMVAGKRYSEFVLVGDEAATRKTLQEYSASYLRFVWSLSAGVTCTAYSLWAFEMVETQDGIPWATISIAPFVLAILRYAMDVDKGAAGAPEEIVLHDRVLLALGLLWAALVGIGVFSA